ncbi:MAG: tetratricopeptide repeat protein [Limnothrix sp. BL-A-16]
MIHDVVSVEVLTGYCLKLGFDDGVIGIVDISQQVRFQGVFAPLADRAFFEQVTVNADIGSIAWPNGADLDPLVLYAAVAKNQTQNNYGSHNKNYQIESIGVANFFGNPIEQAFDQSDLLPGRSEEEIERTAELVQLDRWRQESGDRWAVIVGPGGAGKSTLAAQWFDRDQKSQAWAGRLWTDLGRGPSFAEVARRAIVQFGAASQEQAERLEESELLRRLLVTLQQSPCLWVLDNLETVLEARELPADYRAFWRQWRSSCRGAAGWVLFTSRDLPTEMAAQRLDLTEGFTPEQGANFLQKRGIRGAEADLQAFSRRVHGYPLVLGLAAGFLWAQFGDDPHLSKLPADFFAIADQHRDDPQATLETVLRWSFERLSPELRDWLGRLCALRVAFAFETEDDPQLLQTLVGRSFLIQDQDCLPPTNPDAPRQFVYRWQPIVQQFVQRQQPDLIEAHRFAIAHHDQWYVDHDKWQTKADIDNYIEDWYHEGELAKLTGDRQGEAKSLGNLGLAYDSLGQVQRAIDFHEQHRAISREIGDRQGEAASLGNLGNAYRSLGQFQRAIDLHEQSLAIKREIGDRQGEAASLGNLGLAYRSLGQFQRAIDLHEQSLAIAREIGDRQGEAASLGNLGAAYQSLGQVQRAIDLHEQSLAIKREIGDRQGEADSLGNLGVAYHSLGQFQRAIDFHEQSLAIEREIGDRKGEASSLGNLGNAYYSLGQFQQAINLHEQHRAISREIGDQQGEANSLNNRGVALEKLDRLAEAQADFAMARDLFRQLGQHHYAKIAEQNYQRVTQALQTPPPIPTEKPRSPWWVRLWQAWRRWLRRLFDGP